MNYVKPYFKTLFRRLSEPRRFIQVIAGPRQVGKIRLEIFFRLISVISVSLSSIGMRPMNAE